jgi:glutamate--cysteine ligase
MKFEKRLAAIVASRENLLFGGLKGIEKESLRISADGKLSQRPHPVGLGSALTNRFITTDFSESLLEFVTPAYATTWEALRCVCDIHQFTYAQLDEEMLWAASMPCLMPTNGGIPLARYGSSNVGRMKTIYRRGLGHRYGRQMQTIAGIHFNYSLPNKFWAPYKDIVGDQRSTREFQSEHYLGMVRNVHRFGWLMLYLFGASPAICKSFVSQQADQLPSLNDETLYAPFGTSLRMSDLGYSNQNQSRIRISLNSLTEYVQDLSRAIETPEPAYDEIGIKVDGEYRQLNANLLQIENEYYSSVRPKRVANSGERPTAALRRGGIEYIEVRSLDINIFDPCGINQNTMRFVEAFLIYCLLEDSPFLETAEISEVSSNQTRTAKQGRDPVFRLVRNGTQLPLPDWATQIIEGVAAVAVELDRHDGNDNYSEAVASMQAMVDDSSLTPSARVVGELEKSESGFTRFALDMSTRHRDYFAAIEAPNEQPMKNLEREALESLQRQKGIEAADAVSLDEYLETYFS